MTNTNPRLDIGGNKRTLLVALAGTVLILLACAQYYYRSETERIRQEKYDGIRAIGESKAAEIARWRQRRSFDIGRIVNSPILKRAIEHVIHQPGDRALAAELREHLSIEREGDTYADVILLGPDNKILLSVREAPDPLDPATVQAAAAALRSRTTVFADLYRFANGIIHSDVAAAMLSSDGSPLVVVLRSDAATFLYPLI